jgi:hypothetical protein
MTSEVSETPQSVNHYSTLPPITPTSRNTSQLSQHAASNMKAQEADDRKQELVDRKQEEDEHGENSIKNDTNSFKSDLSLNKDDEKRVRVENIQ